VKPAWQRRKVVDLDLEVEIEEVSPH